MKKRIQPLIKTYNCPCCGIPRTAAIAPKKMENYRKCNCGFEYTLITYPNGHYEVKPYRPR